MQDECRRVQAKRRGWRRHHRKRIIEKFQRIYKGYGYDNWRVNGQRTASAGSIRCGCCMCANPRRRRSYEHTVTRQEKINELNFNEQIGELPEPGNGPDC